LVPQKPWLPRAEASKRDRKKYQELAALIAWSWKNQPEQKHCTMCRQREQKAKLAFG